MTFANYSEFYQYYLTQHSDIRCRYCHYLGSTLVARAC
ncbi:Mpo1-like protein [Halioxenophilus sp. WMMB6]